MHFTTFLIRNDIKYADVSILFYTVAFRSKHVLINQNES